MSLLGKQLRAYKRRYEKKSTSKYPKICAIYTVTNKLLSRDLNKEETVTKTHQLTNDFAG